MEGVITTGAAAGLELQGLEDFAAVVEAHQRRIYRLLLGMLGDAEAAETLTQDCFLRAYRARSSYRGDAKVATWLLKIAVNLARDHARNRRLAFWKRLVGMDGHAESFQEMAADRRASPEQALLAREELRAVWAAVETLSAKQRAVFLLRFVEEMTLAEIAQATGMKAGTVKSHLARAVGAVRKKTLELKPS
jgi:RNA polymerase sigma-70 factor, ECF subfamily